METPVAAKIQDESFQHQQQLLKEETFDDAVYNVYIKKVQYDTPTAGVVEDKKAHLQWRLEESRVIKCGRLEKLVDAMCLPTGDIDSSFVDPFLATYRTFTSSSELMKVIAKRYVDVGESSELSENVREVCQRSLKVVLLVWLETYHEDFREPPSYPTLALLQKFVHENLPDSDLAENVRKKSNVFHREEEGAEILFGPVDDLAVVFRLCFLEAIKKSFAGRTQTLKLLPPLDLLSIPSRHFAEQLTYMDAELFRKVVPHHCLGSVWSHRGDKKHVIQPVTVYATVDQFNVVSHTVIATILKHPYLDSNERFCFIEKWIDIAQECRLLKNFSSLKAIISGLQCNSVYRLKRVWQNVPKDKLNLFKDLANIFNEENNHGLWRELLSREGTAKCVDVETMNSLQTTASRKSVNLKSKMMSFVMTEMPIQTTTMQGTVPYLGTFLTDLTMIDTAFSDFTRDDLVNFEKKRKEFELLAQIQMLQSSAGLYQIKPDPDFFDWFYSIRVYDLNEGHELSNEIEPNTNYPTVERRTHRKNHSLGFFSPRRPASMDDLNFYRDSTLTLKQKDFDSQSVTSLHDIISSGPPRQLIHSISMCSMKSVEGNENPMKFLKDSSTIPVKVYLRTSESHQTNHYKSIMLSNTDHANNVLRNILLKYNILSKPEEYILFQLLPDNKELPLPNGSNIFYAIKKDVGDIKFVVHKRYESSQQQQQQPNRNIPLKHSKRTKSKNRLSRMLFNF